MLSAAHFVENYKMPSLLAYLMSSGFAEQARILMRSFY